MRAVSNVWITAKWNPREIWIGYEKKFNEMDSSSQGDNFSRRLYIIMSRLAFRVTGPLWGESISHRYILFMRDRNAGIGFLIVVNQNKRLTNS